MPLLLCPDCKKLVSDAPSACPKCGRPIRPSDIAQARERGKQNVVVVAGCAGVFLVGFVAMVIWISTSSTSESHSSGPPTTRAGFDVCVSETAITRAEELASDPVAHAKFIANARTGCMLLKPGLEVVTEDFTLRGGHWRIRLPGSTTSAWVSKDAITR